MAYLGLDLGTGSIKAAVVEEDGTVRESTTRAYPIASANPGWAESDPQDWLSAVRSAADELLPRHSDVDGAGFSGQMHGVVLADDQGHALGPAILWADSRSTAQAVEMAASLPASTLRSLGSPPVPGFAATTLRWLGVHQPSSLARAHYALQPKDFLRGALGGEIGTDPSDASGTLLYDVVSGHWDPQAVAWSGVGGERLPQVRPSQAHAGSVQLAGRQLPCVVGGADTACALGGLGLSPGDGFVAVGTGSQVVSVLGEPLIDQTLVTHLFCALGAPGAGWYRLGAVQNAGLILQPTLSLLGASLAEAEAALQEGVQSSDPLFLPYLAGERTPFMDADLRGAWLDLSLATDRAALLRSVMEGIAQAVAFAVEAVEGSGVVFPDPVPLIGGGSHARAFRQLLADASGIALAVVEAPDAAVVGAAMLAAGRVAAPNRPKVIEVVEPAQDRTALLLERRVRLRRHVDAR